MPIRWNALKVSEAADMIVEFVNQTAEPLEQARIVAREARQIANLPTYVDDRLVRLLTQIGRINDVKGAIKAVRQSIPDGAIEEERARLKHGIAQRLI